VCVCVCVCAFNDLLLNVTMETYLNEKRFRILLQQARGPSIHRAPHENDAMFDTTHTENNLSVS